MQIVILPPDNPVFLTFCGLSIRYYGIIMAFAFFVGLFLAGLLVKKSKSQDEFDLFLDYSPVVIVFSIIGARLFYILASLDFYIKNPTEILLINHGGLSIFGAIFFGIFTLYFLSRKNKFNFLSHLDIIAVAFPLCQTIGRFGNFFNQEAYGSATNGIFKLFVAKEYRRPELINVEYYHPTFLYESILDLFIFFILLTLFLKNKNLKSGSISCFYLILYSLVRFIIEGIRIDSVLNIASIPIARIICILLFVFSIFFLFFINKKSVK